MQHGIGNLAQRPEFGLGDFVSDVFKPVRKVVNKVVPRELQPILPVVASAFLGPAVGGMFSALGPAAAGFLGAGTTSALTQALSGSGQIDPMSTLLSAGIGGIQGARIPSSFKESSLSPIKKPDIGSVTTGPSGYPQITETVGALPNVPTPQAPITFTPGTEAYNKAMEGAGFFDKALMRAKEYTGSFSFDPKGVELGDRMSKFKFDRGPESFLKGATAFSLPYASKAAAEEQLDLEEQERQDGLESAADKRKKRKIYIDFVQRAGFSQEEAERMADGAGYDEGGKVMLASDPDPADERNTMRRNFAPKIFGKEYDKLSDDEIIELDEAIEEMTTKAPKKEKRMTAQEGDFVSGIEAILNLPKFSGSDKFLTRIPERSGGANEEAAALLQEMLESDEYYIDEEGNLRKLPTKRPRQNTRPGMNEEFLFDLMQRMSDPTQGRAEGGTAQGGKVPGLPAGKQVDAREGTFIPMGGAKRADDVPAMLSVNEFVLNDNAVAGLGKMLTGTPDPRAGARALYKIQDQLEAMVV